MTNPLKLAAAFLRSPRATPHNPAHLICDRCGSCEHYVSFTDGAHAIFEAGTGQRLVYPALCNTCREELVAEGHTVEALPQEEA